MTIDAPWLLPAQNVTGVVELSTYTRRILVERGMRIVAGCAEKLGEEELRELRARQAALEGFRDLAAAD